MITIPMWAFISLIILAAPFTIAVLVGGLIILIERIWGWKIK